MPTAVEPLERFLAAIEARDRDAMAELVTSDAAWHIPGRNRIGGFHKGREELLGLVETVARWTNGTFAIEPHDLVANDRHAVLLGQLSAQRRGERLTGGLVATFHLEGDMLGDMWAAVSDQYAFDAFFS